MDIIVAQNIVKCYGSKIILDKFNLIVKKGEILSITGPSGSGKSTLLNILGLIEDFNEGQLNINGISNIKVNSTQASKLIRENIGYLFQNFALIDNETVMCNLNLALKYVNLSKNEKQEKISQALKAVGLYGYENKKIYELSGGEQQRISISRLLLKPCDIILADEPTGSLDKKNKDNILKLLKYLNGQGKTIIIVTHDDEVSNISTRRITI
ncbi:putative bacteriocin export ABC transporter [Clostridium sp.]|uniref:putative bacteriocin export ABC transporter n=1 Tax=Clostridium sp. TaxID=1506 RepID=UPI003F3CC11A